MIPNILRALRIKPRDPAKLVAVAGTDDLEIILKGAS